jgi:electron transfer flavoprotein alpha subunit/NAD-dependent dihydropyrimidine dehydrogenase PreA subunit
MPVTIDLARCDGNGECVNACAFAAIEVRDGKAVVFDNCTDCGACVLACAPKAIWSDLFSTTATSAILAVDFTPSSAIANVVDRAASASEASATWMTVDPVDAGAAADAIAAQTTSGGFSVLVLPHADQGPAIAARVAARLGAHLLSGCSEIRFDDAGGVRAVRPRFGGMVKAFSRSGSGATVVTVLPRGVAQVAAAPIELPAREKRGPGEVPAQPVALARRVVTLGPNLNAEAARAARECARVLGAMIVDYASAAAGKQLSPDLYVAFGVDGSTEHNAAFRNSRLVVAVVGTAEAPIAQIADYLLVGDVEEHAKALLAAL